MLQYILRRLLLMIPTLFGITLVVFVIINLAPGSPLEQRLQEIRFGAQGGGAAESVGVSGQNDTGVSDEVLEALKKQYGFDKPIHERYWIWLKNLAQLDFGESFKYEAPAIDVIVSKFPVSLQFGIISIILTYLVCIVLGVAMAVRDGTAFDRISSLILFVAYAIPPVILAILLLVFFAGGSFVSWFPIGYLHGDDYEYLSLWGKIVDRVHHFILPLICYMIGSFTTLTLLTKNSLLDEIKKDYVRTAWAKGLDRKTVVFRHALRNSLIPVVTGIGGFLTLFLSGSLIIESIFQLDGIGLLGYNSTLARDYNVLMGLLFLSSLATLLGNLLTDIIYVFVDPRIDFQ